MNTVVLDLRYKSEFKLIKQIIDKYKSHYFYAFSPLAAFLLHKYGIEYSTVNDLIDHELFLKETMGFFEYFENVSQKYFGNDRLYYGIIRQGSCFACIDRVLDCKKSLARKKIIITDRNYDFENDKVLFSEIRANKLLMYNNPVDEVIKVEPKELSVIKEKRLINKIFDILSPESIKVKKTRLLYKRKSSKNLFKINSDVLNLISKTKCNYIDINDMKRLFKSDKNIKMSDEQTKFVNDITNFYHNDILKKSFKNSFLDYISAISFVKKHISNFNNYIGTYASDDIEYLVGYFLNKNNKNYIDIQHGSNFLRNKLSYYLEFINSSIRFARGVSDGNWIKSLSGNFSKDTYSSGSLKKYPKNLNISKGIYVYFLNSFKGDEFMPENYHTQNDIDYINMWHRIEKVVALFRNYPSKKLIIKVHPQYLGKDLYIPIKELVENIDNIEVADNNYTVCDLLTDTGVLILDYLCTTLIEGINMGIRNIISYCGKPYLLTDEMKKEAEKVALLSFDNNEFVNKIQKVINNEIKFPNVEKHFKDYLYKYHDSGKTNKETINFVSEILKEKLLKF